MKQAIKVIAQIKGFYDSMIKSNSPYLKNDYSKRIRALKRDLKEYCSYKNINYKKLCLDYNI